MLKRMIIQISALAIVIAFAGVAQGQENLQKYFSDTASKVKATSDPVQKREILNNSFEKMLKAMNTVESSPLISKDDKIGIDRIRVIIKDKQDELAGLNGFDRVPDDQLNAYSNFVVQDMEQATETITISVVALLLIIIIVILVV
jgi:hypothetical protein